LKCVRARDNTATLCCAHRSYNGSWLEINDLFLGIVGKMVARDGWI
jgi:hypothetical protein